jgi:hypothetical protein
VPPRRSASLKPQLSQIRTWVQEGATDIWIAHKVGSTPASIANFRRQHGISRDAGRVAEPEPQPVEEAAPPAPEPPEAPAAERDDGAEGDGARKRRRGRRGGRGRRADATAPLVLEGVFDHGEDGYGLWLDASVRDAAVYRAHWAGERAVTVTVTPDEIVIRRADA